MRGLDVHENIAVSARMNQKFSTGQTMALWGFIIGQLTIALILLPPEPMSYPQSAEYVKDLWRLFLVNLYTY